MSLGRFIEMSVIVASIAVGTVGSYWFFEVPIITYIERRILTPVVPPGGELVISIKSNAKTRCPTTVARYILDSAQVRTEYEEEKRAPTDDFVVRLKIPLGAAPGPAIYFAKVSRQCNPLQELWPFVIEQTPLTFTIQPLPNQEQLPQQQGIYEAPQ